jgi:cytochrome b561
MERPFPGDEPEWPFALHEWVGVAALAVLVLFWTWTFLRHRSETPFSLLIPWFSGVRRRAVFIDAKRRIGRLMALGAPVDGESNKEGAFPSAVHGLGLLVASVMAVSGAAYFFFFEGTSVGAAVLGLHKLFANLMWAYLVGHASLAMIHAVRGDGVLSRMFWLRRGRASAAESR